LELELAKILFKKVNVLQNFASELTEALFECLNHQLSRQNIIVSEPAADIVEERIHKITSK